MHTQPAIRVFIYGSLLPGHHNHHVVSPYIQHYEQGRIRGRLVDFGPYPAAVRDEAARRQAYTIRGLWITVSRQGLAAMDVLEGFQGIEEPSDYDRIWTVDHDNASLSGWTYVWSGDRSYPAIPGDYWPDYLIQVRQSP
ncbi:gamma-glutamylcyclotransferase [Paenibacillus sp. GCM10023252]|uniref:gamma-glutamylcyclotransferase family protein n=1 Tax=Paenibacillus sp. GCM10023252 TaxID=3252649 RepID=UPI00360A685F